MDIYELEDQLMALMDGFIPYPNNVYTLLAHIDKLADSEVIIGTWYYTWGGDE